MPPVFFEKARSVHVLIDHVSVRRRRRRQCSSPRLDSVSDENAAFNPSPNPRRSICMPRGHGTYEMQWVIDCW